MKVQQLCLKNTILQFDGPITKLCIVELNGDEICSYCHPRGKQSTPWCDFLLKIKSQVIEHSRKLLLEVYEKQIIKILVQGFLIYYRAKYSILTLVIIQCNWRIDRIIIGNIILEVLTSYENLCLNLFHKVKLPRKINHHQKIELLKLKSTIALIINNILGIKVMRMNSLKSQTIQFGQQSDHLLREINKKKLQAKWHKIQQLVDQTNIIFTVNNELVRYLQIKKILGEVFIVLTIFIFFYLSLIF